MRRALAHSASRFSGHGTEINATPLIDVVMCLIVFYLIVGRMASDLLAPVELPITALGSRETETRALIINVLPVEGAEAAAPPLVVVERERIGSDAHLVALIRARIAEEPATIVQVRGDRRLPFGAIDPVLRACAAAGAHGVRLVSEQSP